MGVATSYNSEGKLLSPGKSSLFIHLICLGVRGWGFCWCGTMWICLTPACPPSFPNSVKNTDVDIEVLPQIWMKFLCHRISTTHWIEAWSGNVKANMIVNMSSEISVRRSTNGNGLRSRMLFHGLDIYMFWKWWGGQNRWRLLPLMPEQSVFKKKSVIVVDILPISIKPQV